MNAKAVSSDEEAILSPRETADLFGHEEAEQILLNAEASGRLPHAWLITGPKGIGKATLAYRFARYLFSRETAGEVTSAAGGLFSNII